MARVKDLSGFRSGFQQSSALLEQWLGRVVGWRLFSPRMVCLGRETWPYAMVSAMGRLRQNRRIQDPEDS